MKATKVVIQYLFSLAPCYVERHIINSRSQHFMTFFWVVIFLVLPHPSLTHSKLSFHTFYVPDTVLGVGGTRVNRMKKLLS